MTEIRLYKSPRKAFRYFALAIPLVIIGVWLITRAESSLLDKIMGWFGTFFFGSVICIAFFHLFDKRPQIIINENGLWDRSTKQDLIKWELIIHVAPLNIFGQKFITLTMAKSFKLKTKRYGWAKRLSDKVGSTGLDIPLSQIKINQFEMIRFIMEMIKTEEHKKRCVIEKYFDN